MVQIQFWKQQTVTYVSVVMYIFKVFVATE